MHFPPAPSLQETLRQRQAELEREAALMAWARRHPRLWTLRWRWHRICRAWARLVPWLVLALLLTACQVDHEVDGEVELTAPWAVEWLDDAVLALLPFALVGSALPATVPDDEVLYCVDTAAPCITAGDTRDAAYLLGLLEAARP